MTGSPSSIRAIWLLSIVGACAHIGCATPMKKASSTRTITPPALQLAKTPPTPKHQPSARYSVATAKRPAPVAPRVRKGQGRKSAKVVPRRVARVTQTRSYLTSWFTPPPPSWFVPPPEKAVPPAKPPYPTIPMPKHKSFKWIVRRFRTSQWGFTRTILKRRGLYRSIILREIKRMKLPLGLVVLAGIESNYTPRLVSATGAMGMWQFIDTTGKAVGLKRTPWVDERRDLVKSTRAALKYVHKLYKMFDGRWGLAIAAYNCGPGCVRAAMKRCKGKSVWTMRLWRSCGLSAEARKYVARFFALVYYLKNPPNGWKAFPYIETTRFATLRTPHAVSLLALSKKTGIPLRKLYELNPELTSWMTPPRTRYPLKVPPTSVAKVRRFLRKPFTLHRWQPLKLREGMTLRSISRKYRIPRSVLRNVNRAWGRWSLKERKFLMLPLPKNAKAWPKRLKRPQRKHLASLARKSRRFRWRYPAYFRYHSRERYISHKKKLPCYTARKGDTFHRIAKRFKTSPKRLRKRNSHIAQLRVGHKIRVFSASRCYVAPPLPRRSFRLPLAN